MDHFLWGGCQTDDLHRESALAKRMSFTRRRGLVSYPAVKMVRCGQSVGALKLPLLLQPLLFTFIKTRSRFE